MKSAKTQDFVTVRSEASLSLVATIHTRSGLDGGLSSDGPGVARNLSESGRFVSLIALHIEREQSTRVRG